MRGGNIFNLDIRDFSNLSSMIMVWAYGVEEKVIGGGQRGDSSQKGGKKYVAKEGGSWYKWIFRFFSKSKGV